MIKKLSSPDSHEEKIATITSALNAKGLLDRESEQLAQALVVEADLINRQKKEIPVGFAEHLVSMTFMPNTLSDNTEIAAISVVREYIIQLVAD